MKILHEYDFCNNHYGLVELDDGSKVEIQDSDPIKRAKEMQNSGAFSAVVAPSEKTIADFSDVEIVAEIDRRKIKQIVQGVMI
jgi:hypothetical protein